MTAPASLSPEALDGLNRLVRLGHDLSVTYATAQARVRDPALAATLEGLRLENLRTLSDLTALVLREGGFPTGRRDARGPLMEGAAALSARFGDEIAVRALRRTELLAASTYADALEFALPEEAWSLVHRALEQALAHAGKLIAPDPRHASDPGRPG